MTNKYDIADSDFEKEIANAIESDDLEFDDKNSYELKEDSVNINLNKPTEEESAEFSIEEINNDKSFGIHKSWVYNIIPNFCEGIDELIKLNNLMK